MSLTRNISLSVSLCKTAHLSCHLSCFWKGKTVPGLFLWYADSESRKKKMLYMLYITEKQLYVYLILSLSPFCSGRTYILLKMIPGLYITSKSK